MKTCWEQVLTEKAHLCCHACADFVTCVSQALCGLANGVKLSLMPPAEQMLHQHPQHQATCLSCCNWLMARKCCCAETWLFKDLKKTFEHSYGVELFTDLDYKVAMAQSNPHHKVLHFAASDIHDFSALGSRSPRGCGMSHLGMCHYRHEKGGCLGPALVAAHLPFFLLWAWPIQYTDKDSLWYLQAFFDRLFPTREVFAALAPFILQLAPQYEREVQAFMGTRFRLYNIGIQIRRRKCNGDRHDLSCELRPSIEAYCQVGSALIMSLSVFFEFASSR